MKYAIKALGIALVAALVMWLAACGRPEPIDLITRSRQSIQTVANYEARSELNLRVNTGGMQQNDMITGMDINMTMDLVAFASPPKAKASMEMQLFGMPLNVEMYTDQTHVYSLVAGTWFRSPVTDPAAAANSLDAAAAMRLYLDNAKTYKLDGSEQIGIHDCYRITGYASGDSLETVLAQNAMLEHAGLGEAQLKDAGASFDDLGDAPVTIWIDKESSYPIRYAFDLTDMMKTLMKRVDPGADARALEIETFVMQLTLSNINQASDFDIPAEALSAEEIEASELS